MTGAAPLVRLDRIAAMRGRRRVLDDVSLRVDPGDVVAIHGANGAGKTTLLRVVAGLVRPCRGVRQGPARTAYVPAVIAPPAMAAQTWLARIPRPRRSDVAPWLDLLGYDAPHDAACRALSFGNLRKMLLAEAFASGESLVVIDEASVGLDQGGLEGLWTAVARHGAGGGAVVLAEQDARSVPGASWTGRLVRGRLAEGSSAHRTAVTLWGPAGNRAALIDAGASLGFAPHPDTP